MELLSKLAYALTQYAWLSGLALSALGAGAWLIDRCVPSAGSCLGLRLTFSVTTGLGILIVAFLALAVAGWFKPAVVGALLLAALAAGALWLIRALALSAPAQHEARRQVRGWFWIALLLLIALPYLVKPLVPPYGWDELMYHLPYAKLWAERGKLVVDPWLRFPLFPMNFDLLYAAALLFGNDVLPHLIHASAAVLVCIGLALAGSRYFGAPAGVIAALLFLASASWGFDVAYIDLGLTLFIAFAFFALALWYEGMGDRLMVLAAFLLGLAAGTKYQALVFAPVIAAWIVLRARRPVSCLAAVLAFAVGGAFWYARSLVVSGDPFHPIGAEIFGFWQWDRGDLAGQFEDIRAHPGWPKWYMWPALLAVFFVRGSTGTYRALCVSGYAALALWLVTTCHERYLMPAYPLLALMSGTVLVRVSQQLGLHALASRVARSVSGRTASAMLAAALLPAGFLSLNATRPYARTIPATPELRDAFLRERVPAYEIFRSLPPGRDWRLYQFGFEGELYYSPVFVVGDWFGPARYRHVFELAFNPAALARWLRSLDLNGFVVNTRQPLFGDTKFGPDFSDHFELVAETKSARLYWIRDR